MYLTAHRPIGPPNDLLGINTYLYTHGVVWPGHPPPKTPDPVYARGHEAAPRVEGNLRRLRSYLDIVGPDDAGLDEVRQAIAHLHRVVTSGIHGPWTHVCGRCSVEFGLEAALAGVWHAELHWLWGDAEQLWRVPGYANA